MSKEEILNLFYNHVVPEAYSGRVDCYFMYNIYFYTRIPQKNLELISDDKVNGSLMVPTLYVRDCEKFEQLLVKYVNKALEFYDDSNFCEELLTGNFIDEGKGVSKEKVILTLLWANATIEDFQNPCDFLRKRINFFDLGEFSKYSESQIVGYSEIFGTDIECSIKKSKIESETPYFLQTFLLSPEDGKRIYEFPKVYFGVSEGIANIYAIQSGKNRLIDKKIERKMYKVNEGLDVKEDIYDNYGFANLKDVTPSFLVVANILMGLIKNQGIQKVNVVSILVSRWNAKIRMMDFKKDFFSKRGYTPEGINDLLNEYYDKTKSIQINLTDKFLRTFRRLGYHHSSVGIVGYPMEFDSNLSLFLYEQDDVCNNKLLDETFKFKENKLLKK